MSEDLHFFEGLPQIFTVGTRTGQDSIDLAKYVFDLWDAPIQALLEPRHPNVHEAVYNSLATAWKKVHGAINGQDVGTLFAEMTTVFSALRQIEMVRAYSGGRHRGTGEGMKVARARHSPRKDPERYRERFIEWMRENRGEGPLSSWIAEGRDAVGVPTDRNLGGGANRTLRDWCNSAGIK